MSMCNRSRYTSVFDYGQQSRSFGAIHRHPHFSPKQSIVILAEPTVKTKPADSIVWPPKPLP